MPPMLVRTGFWRRHVLRSSVARLWRLAYESDLRFISPRQFIQLAAKVENVKSALAAGELLVDRNDRELG